LEDEFVAEQATDTVDGAGSVASTGTAGTVAHGTSEHLEHNPGRPISWTGTIITIVGFVIGGIAFPISDPAPNWIVFWVGTAVAIVGLLILLFSKAMSTDWY
jgi:lipoprotein signal peptidase